MPVNTINELIALLTQIDQDATVLAAIANDPANSTEHGPSAGLVTTRLGDNVKNIQKVIADVGGDLPGAVEAAANSAIAAAESALAAAASVTEASNIVDNVADIALQLVLFDTVAEMIASTKLLVNQTVRLSSGESYKIKPVGTYTTSPTVLNLTGISGQAVSTSLDQDCTFADDTRTIAFLRSVHGSITTVTASYKGHAIEIDLSQVASFNQTSGGGVEGTVLPGAGNIYYDSAFDTSTFTDLQAALDAAGGATFVLSKVHDIGSNTLVMSNPGTKMTASVGAGISYTDPTQRGVEITAVDCEVCGLTINAPEVFTASAGQPTYGVFWITANRVSIHDNTLNNVPKHGIAFDEADTGLVYNNTINGNYPISDYDGVTTLSHSGIRCNTTAVGDQGKFIIYGNTISGCVQGVLSGNFGVASRNQGFSVYGNIFTECWNHGIYASSSNSYAWSVTGNTFIRCQKPIALFGWYHVVTGNTLTAGGFSGTSAEFVGISMRDSIGCIVANNTVQGEVEGGGTVINLTQVDGTVVKDNVVSGNVINITGAALGRIIGIGSSSTVDLSGNVVTGNVIMGAAPEFSGLIWLNAAPGASAQNSIIANNSITMTGACDAIGLVNCVGTKVSGNAIELKFDSGTAKTVPGIKITSCADIDISGNTVTCTAAFGLNVTLRAIWEQTSGSGSRATSNIMRADLTKLSSATKYVTNNASGIIIDDVGSGAPTFNAGVGSRYGRTDGGAGTSFYVKESGTTSAGWVAK